MQRLRRLMYPLALAVALAVVVSIVVEESAADIDNLVFTSRPDRLRLLLPRPGWRWSELKSYPGVLLWLARSQPPGQILLTAEAFTRDLYCSWPVTCRTSRDTLPAAKYACALRVRLEAQHLRVGPIQAGPRETEAAGLPSVWFEFDDGKHFLRQAIAMSADRAFSLVLSAPTADARATHTRAFEQALRTMQLLTPEETARAAVVDAAVPVGDAVPSDAVLVDGAVLDGGVAFETAPPPSAAIAPIGPCPPR
jgi:hypothetical protein